MFLDYWIPPVKICIDGHSELGKYRNSSQGSSLPPVDNRDELHFILNYIVEIAYIHVYLKMLNHRKLNIKTWPIVFSSLKMLSTSYMTYIGNTVRISRQVFTVQWGR